jgi:hypothetical protein
MSQTVSSPHSHTQTCAFRRDARRKRTPVQCYRKITVFACIKPFESGSRQTTQRDKTKGVLFK